MLTPPVSPELPAPRAIATWTCARSIAKFFAQFHINRPHTSRQKPSIAIIVLSEGVPAGPWKISKFEVRVPVDTPAGSMNVMEA